MKSEEIFIIVIIVLIFLAAFFINRKSRIIECRFDNCIRNDGGYCTCNHIEITEVYINDRVKGAMICEQREPRPVIKKKRFWDK